MSIMHKLAMMLGMAVWLLIELVLTDIEVSRQNKEIISLKRELHVHENHIRDLLGLHGGRYGEDRMELKK